MPSPKKGNSNTELPTSNKTAAQLHPRNRHQGRYDFDALIKETPKLASFVFLNPYGDQSINFADPNAVKTLNRALLKSFYGIAHWDIPANYLCPPIPGRADYVHYLADLLANSSAVDGKFAYGLRVPSGLISTWTLANPLIVIDLANNSQSYDVRRRR